MRLPIWIVLCQLFWITACQEPITIDLPEKEPQIVAISNISPNDYIKVFVSREKQVNSEAATTYVNDAIVRVRFNDLALGKFTFVPPDGEYPNVPYYQSNFFPKIGRTYTLEVEVPDGPQLRASNTIPPMVAIKEVFLDSITVDYPDLDRNLALYTYFGKIRIDDPPGADNFYHFAEVIIPIDWFSFSQGDTCCIRPNVESYLVPVAILDSQDPAFLALRQENGFVFSDRDFDGQSKSIPFRASILLNKGFQRASKLQVLLRSVSRDYYRYHSTFTRQLAAREAPLAEPVIIFNNIENGLGNFSGYSTAVDSTSLIR